MGDPSANPLIADRKDSTQWYTGIGIAEGIADIVQGVESGSWVDGIIGGLATGLEALAFVLDPLGGLVSWGVGWLIEHVKPLSDALDWLAGDPDQITAYAGTWKNVAKAVGEAATELADAVAREVASWAGDAGDAYRSYADRHVQALRNLAEASGAMSSITTGAALLVSLVRELVRDIIAEFVSVLAVRLWEWLAIEAGTLGIGTPWVVAQVSSLVAKWAAKIARLVTGLVRSLNNLVPIVRRLDDLIDALKGVLRGLRNGPALPTGRGPGGGSTVRGPTAKTPGTPGDPGGPSGLDGPSLAGSPDPVIPGKLSDLDPTGPRTTNAAGPYAAAGHADGGVGSIPGRSWDPTRESPRGPGDVPRSSQAGGPGDRPTRQQIVDELRQLNPQPTSRHYGSVDGHYYADRVFAGGRPDGERVFAGHGYLEPGAGEITVPPGTSISFYVDHGELLPGIDGVAVEGGVYPGSAVQTFTEGQTIPNYTLAPPNSGPWSTTSVFENSTTVAQRTRLSDLLQAGMGNVHWAACREDRFAG